LQHGKTDLSGMVMRLVKHQLP